MSATTARGADDGHVSGVSAGASRLRAALASALGEVHRLPASDAPASARLRCREPGHLHPAAHCAPAPALLPRAAHVRGLNSEAMESLSASLLYTVKMAKTLMAL